MNQVVQLERQISRQRAENAYYRDCYSLFKFLQRATEHTIRDLRQLYESNPLGTSNYSTHQRLWSLQNIIFSIIEKSCESEAGLDDLCPLDTAHSATAVLEPIRRTYTEPEGFRSAFEVAGEVVPGSQQSTRTERRERKDKRQRDSHGTLGKE